MADVFTTASGVGAEGAVTWDGDDIIVHSVRIGSDCWGVVLHRSTDRIYAERIPVGSVVRVEGNRE